MSHFEQCKRELWFLARLGEKHEKLKSNSAWQIMSELHEKFNKYESFDVFFLYNKEVDDKCTKIILESNVFSYIGSKEKLQALGRYVKEMTNGRFKREITKCEDENEEYYLDWLKRNENLDVEKDKLIVQASYFVMFLMRE